MHKVKIFLTQTIIVFLFLGVSSGLSEDLSDVLKDAYNFFPDIKKVKKTLKTQRKICRYPKLTFYLL